ncbi:MULTISPECIES: hypothetical protein [Sphingobacterium]|uniref:hypothetical protein n=1 Tax=Sphingobacterium TaxID=28453 RepID=UPI00257F9D82|nr:MULTISPECIES: hypothetical protein [Sphingobacterium]
MNIKGYYIAFLTILCWLTYSLQPVRAQRHNFDFYDGKVSIDVSPSFNIPFDDSLTGARVQEFYQAADQTEYRNLVNSLLDYKDKQHLNDWVYYQLVRRTAQQIAPKAENYARYTLYKWFLMCKSGYDARLGILENQIILYIKSKDDISDLPFFNLDNDNYVCLNYHDYINVFNYQEKYKLVDIKIPEAKNSFSYKLTKLPDFKPDNYKDKEIGFKYNGKAYHFKLKVNSDVNEIFKNYPIVDYETYFNIPLSKETYESIIPFLKLNTAKMSIKKGVDYLMQFTRYSFLYEDDREIYGKERRFPPEQTLINDISDCDDRAALFFYLVKEIYDLPMIALRYPTHLTLAIQFDKPVGKSILYNGNYYTLCEPTPQEKKLKIGEQSLKHQGENYQVVYHYKPHGLKK